ncbi:MAG: branched-chain amino acid ABC transporter permease [Spirochaetota bacterium]|nr:MAG: branched-chain amino acid ABC transporter permease [Spirochaetota bacterium]
MNQILIQFTNGITYAGLLFMIASGFTLIFGVMRVINMSHGAFYILGAFIAYTIQKQTGNWLSAIIVGSVTVAATAFIVRLLVSRVKGALPQTVLTLGIAMMIGDLCLYIWGGLPRTVGEPIFTQNPVPFAGLTYPTFRFFVLGLACVVGGGMWYMLQRTQLGRILRAGTDNRSMTSALGINIDRIFTLVFIMTGFITGMSGAVGGTYIAFGPGSDFVILTYALVVVIMGGMGSIAGSALGALIVGIVDSFGRAYVHEVAIFLLMGTLIIVLAFRPQGLLGREE